MPSGSSLMNSSSEPGRWVGLISPTTPLQLSNIFIPPAKCRGEVQNPPPTNGFTMLASRLDSCSGLLLFRRVDLIEIVFRVVADGHDFVLSSESRIPAGSARAPKRIMYSSPVLSS